MDLILTSCLPTHDNFSVIWRTVLLTRAIYVILANDVNLTLAQIMKAIILARSNGWKIISSNSNSLHLIVDLAILTPVSHVCFLSFTAGQSVSN